MYKEIVYEVDGPAAVITLNRPDALNAWTPRMAGEFRHAVYRAEADPEVVGIVVTGAGRGFCAGADMKSLDSLSQGGDFVPETEGLEWDRAEPVPEDFDGDYTWLLAVNKPVVAAINGAIAGMAIPIALCCDIRFMAADAAFVTAFAQRGLIAEWGTAWLLPRLVGPSNALDLLFSPRRVTGADAAAMGAVNKALPADEVLPHSIRYVKDLAASSAPRSMAIMKRQVYEQLMARLGPSEKEARWLMNDSFRRGDFKEGLASFREKRPPRFARLSGQPDRPDPARPRGR